MDPKNDLLPELTTDDFAEAFGVNAAFRTIRHVTAWLRAEWSHVQDSGLF
jgi:hypothetical protein